MLLNRATLSISACILRALYHKFGAADLYPAYRPLDLLRPCCARLLALLVGQPDRAPSCDFRYAKAPHYVRRGDLTATRQVHLATGESRGSASPRGIPEASDTGQNTSQVQDAFRSLHYVAVTCLPPSACPAVTSISYLILGSDPMSRGARPQKVY